MKNIFRMLLFILALIELRNCFMDKPKIQDMRRRLQTLTQSPEDPSNNFQSLKVPLSIYELSSPVDYATQNQSNQNGPQGIINVSPMNHDANYIKIADELRRYEDAYTACINNLSDNDFSDETVDNCVGINYNYVYDDADYEKSKILARADSAIRDFMIQHCYSVAGVDLVLANACDLIENDVINLLWNELKYQDLLDYHRNKYLFEHSYMNETIFDSLLSEFKIIQTESSSLLTELYDHRQLTITHLEDVISLRTSDIIAKYSQKNSYFDSGLNTKIIAVDYGSDYNYNDYYKKRGLKESEKDKNSPISRFLKQNNNNLKIRANSIESGLKTKNEDPTSTAEAEPVQSDKSTQNDNTGKIELENKKS